MYRSQVLLLASSVFWALTQSNALSAEPSKRPSKTPPVAQSKFDYQPLVESMSELGERAKACNGTYVDETAAIDLDARYELAQRTLKDPLTADTGLAALRIARHSLIAAKDKEGWKYQACSADARSRADQSLPALISKIPDQQVRSQYISAVAQLMTVLDVVAQRTFEEEMNKYATQVNVLKLSAKVAS
jgi:hypothetical protein